MVLFRQRQGNGPKLQLVIPDSGMLSAGMTMKVLPWLEPRLERQGPDGYHIFWTSHEDAFRRAITHDLRGIPKAFGPYDWEKVRWTWKRKSTS